MDGSAFRRLGEALAVMFCLCVVFVPLGLWKAIELLIALFKHVAWI